jgi:hypothetical protein
MSEFISTVLSVDQLASLVHKSPSSIRSDASRNPDALPPICRLPGNKRLLFRLEDVEAWLANHVQHKPGNSDQKKGHAQSIAIKKRGRPRKTAPLESSL